MFEVPGIASCFLCVHCWHQATFPGWGSLQVQRKTALCFIQQNKEVGMDSSRPLQQEVSPPQLSSERECSENARSTMGQLSSGQPTQWQFIIVQFTEML